MKGYTEEQLQAGEGLSCQRSMKAFTYDGKVWHTCELNESVKGDPIEVVAVPPASKGGWSRRG